MSRRADSRPGPGAAGPVDASMTLLNEVMRRPLDPGYQQAADRRSAGGPPAGLGHRLALLVLAIALGLLTAAAAIDLRAPEPAVAQARALLEGQIADRTALAESLLADNESRSAEIASLQSAALGAQDPELLATLAADGVTAGAVAVQGPGLRLTLQDSDVAAADPEQADPDERVQDVDLQIAVNGLWRAGAEAIAVNGHRLTAITAIRSAGSAILVDLVPLSGPYVVEAIGEPGGLATEFARTTGGQHLATLRNVYGIGVDISSEDELALPGSAELRLRSATVLVPEQDAGTGVPSSDPTREEEQP
ncbi:DUF881 domain-containing protein [Pengzhenrongella sicca]|uniref:DUF881 domain-containing protein n=1 Tax=Pengzhenrongella sicca TaxID=2819238 RepID=A0A8A4Z8R2_9MICO|nr:DUF881 domain-containing protein [Pengzhenrongella sicca]QTE27855.1 DUF881 domain-containing protein [Pengzhenrongella sicca]